MCVLILLCGMLTRSWYAELAFRTRVSMSAIGSVMVMRSCPSRSCGGLWPFPPWSPQTAPEGGAGACDEEGRWTIDQPRGMDITIVSTARTNAEGRALLDAFGFPFKREGQ